MVDESPGFFAIFAFIAAAVQMVDILAKWLGLAQSAETKSSSKKTLNVKTRPTYDFLHLNPIVN